MYVMRGGEICMRVCRLNDMLPAADTTELARSQCSGRGERMRERPFNVIHLCFWQRLTLWLLEPLASAKLSAGMLARVRAQCASFNPTTFRSPTENLPPRRAAA